MPPGGIRLGRSGVEALDLDLGKLLARESFDPFELAFRLRGDEGHGAPGAPGAPGASDAVDVVLGLRGHVVVDDVIDAAHVDAAREHVGGDDDVRLAGGKRVERASTLALALVGVDGGRLEPAARKAPRARVGAAARACEHDDALCPPGREQRREQRRLGGLRDAHDGLLDLVGGVAALGDLDRRRVAQQRADAVAHGVVDRRGEQKRLPLARHGGGNPFHRGQKAHVEHAVGLVEDEHFDVREVGRTALHEVDEAPRRGDEHVDAAFELGDLGIVRKPSHDGEDAMARRQRYLCADVADLLGELARGGDDEQERPCPPPRLSEAVHCR